MGVGCQTPADLTGPGKTACNARTYTRPHTRAYTGHERTLRGSDGPSPPGAPSTPTPGQTLARGPRSTGSPGPGWSPHRLYSPRRPHSTPRTHTRWLPCRGCPPRPPGEGLASRSTSGWLKGRGVRGQPATCPRCAGALPGPSISEPVPGSLCLKHVYSTTGQRQEQRVAAVTARLGSPGRAGRQLAMALGSGTACLSQTRPSGQDLGTQWGLFCLIISEEDLGPNPEQHDGSGWASGLHARTAPHPGLPCL